VPREGLKSETFEHSLRSHSRRHNGQPFAWVDARPGRHSLLRRA